MARIPITPVLNKEWTIADVTQINIQGSYKTIDNVSFHYKEFKISEC